MIRTTDPGYDAVAGHGGGFWTYCVPADMTYREWEKAFVEGGDKKGLAVANAEYIMGAKSQKARVSACGWLGA